MNFDEKELNVPVKWNDLFDHLREFGIAIVYLRTGSEFETIILRASENWSVDLTKQYIMEKRLFRRRNKPFKSMME